MTRYAITGVSGYLGGRVARRLDARESTETILGFDVGREPSGLSKMSFHRMDVRDRGLVDRVREARIDCLVHLAFVVNPTFDEWEMRDINIGGTRNVLRAIEAAGVPRSVFLSSGTAYGAHPDNPVLLDEDARLRGNEDFRYAADKVEMERQCERFLARRPEHRMTVLRPCIVLGPATDNYISANFLDYPIVPLIGGMNPPLQFVHEDDVEEAIVRAIDKGPQGAFNVAGRGTIDLREMAALTGRRAVRVPRPLMRAFGWLQFRLKLATTPPSLFDFVTYPWVMSSGKAEKILGFVPKHTSREALLALFVARGRPVAAGTGGGAVHQAG